MVGVAERTAASVPLAAISRNDACPVLVAHVITERRAPFDARPTPTPRLSAGVSSIPSGSSTAPAALILTARALA